MVLRRTTHSKVSSSIRQLCGLPVEGVWVSLVAPPEHFGEGAVQLLLDFVWKGRGLSFAVQFNRFPGGIYNEAAVLTMLVMTHELLRQGGVQFAIQVFRNLPNYLFASHGFILV